MSTFKKKMAGQCNILTDRYIPASLPTYGQGLENFVTSDYSMTKAEVSQLLHLLPELFPHTLRGTGCS